MDDINRNTNLEEAVIVEWNEHMFSTDLERFPIHPDSPYDPEPRYDDPLAVYLQRLDDDGIDHGVIVQPTPYWDDHSLLLDCLEREPRRLHGTCLFNPQDLDAGRKMVDLVAQQERIIACRFHGLEGMDQPAPATYAAGVLSQWRQALELGLVVELHINAKYARATAAALREMPESTVLIDHLAEPHTTSAVDYADLLDLASFDQVFMKLSGLGHFAGDAPLYASAMPFTARVIAAYGPDNLVWGSGTPDIVDAHMPRHTEAERKQVKGDNLARLLQVEDQKP